MQGKKAAPTIFYTLKDSSVMNAPKMQIETSVCASYYKSKTKSRNKKNKIVTSHEISAKPDIQTEREWIAKAQRDPAAFERLFNLYYNDIFNYALRRTGHIELAQDITSNTFLQALDNITQFRWQGIRFSSWLFRIATNELNLDYRKAKRMVPLTPDLMRTVHDDKSSDSRLLRAEEELARNELFQKMHAALMKLKVRYQAVLTLRYFENKSMKEIAEILDLSENTVKTHIRRGLIALREIL